MFLHFLPWVLERGAPTVTEDMPLLDAYSLLPLRQIDFLPVVRDSRIVGMIIGKQLLNLLHRGRKFGYEALITMRVGDIMIRDVPRVGQESSLAELLELLIRSGLGNACIVDEDGKIVGVVSFRDIIRYMTRFNINTGITLREVSSKAVTINPDATLEELVSIMYANYVRRVVVTGLIEWPAIVDDRSIFEYMFTLQGLMTLKEKPGEFFSTRVENLPLAEPLIVDGDIDVSWAWATVYKSPAECILLKEAGAWRIVTPWDLVVKPYLLGVCASLRGFFNDYRVNNVK